MRNVNFSEACMRKQEEKVEDGEDTKMYIILLSTWVHMQSQLDINSNIIIIIEILPLCSLCNNAVQ